ncbi:MAG: DapH/DapD/GlmU-related protein [Phycisphaerae bacterium]|jgi:acetyltransferase-like isoleucine patch superfamily enzyme
MKLRLKTMQIASAIVHFLRMYRYRIQGYKNIHKSVILERGLNLDKVCPDRIHIGKNTLVASRVTILAHEHVKRDPENRFIPFMADTYIGENCFIGISAIILPGVKIGDHVIIGAGAVVTKDIPSNVIAVGNPAHVIRTGIVMNSRAELCQ